MTRARPYGSYQQLLQVLSATFEVAITDSSTTIASLRRLTQGTASQVRLERGALANTRPTLLGAA